MIPAHIVPGSIRDRFRQGATYFAYTPTDAGRARDAAA